MPHTRTAVVIEDDADIGGLIHAVLGMDGVSVLLTGTGARGVAAVREQSPDIVLLDYRLPDITGLEALRRIRSFSDIHVLMLTGDDYPSETLLCAGADAVMTKPFRPRALRTRVQETLGLQNRQP